MTILKGYLREVASTLENNDETECCTYSYVFMSDNEDTHIEDVENISKAPINRRIKVEFDENKLISWEYLQQTLSFINENIKDIALVKVVEEGNLRPEYYTEVEKEAKDLQHFYTLTNTNKWETVVVTPYVVENTPRQSVGLYNFRFSEVRDQMEAQHPGKYDEHTYFHGWGGHNGNILGLAFINSDKAWTYASGQRTIRHEQGHNFGCNHSSTENAEYGDPTCIMAKARCGFNLSQLAKMKLIEEEDIVEAEKNSTYYIVPAEVPHTDMKTGEYKGILLKKVGTGYPYMLSTRKTSEQSYLGYGETENVLHVHKVHPTFSNNPRFETTINPGESKDLHGFTVNNIVGKDGVIKVGIDNPTSSDWPDSLPIVEGDQPEEGQSGVWHNPDFKHQGIDILIDTEREKFVGYWFTYHPQGPHTLDFPAKHNGKEWLMLDGELKDGYVDITIYSLHGRERKTEGVGTMVFDGDTALFRFYTKMFGRDSWNLEKLTPTKSGTTGIWSSGKFEGYSVAQYNGGYAVYYYGHGPYNNVVWEAYQGNDIRALPGYSITNSYKRGFPGELEELPPLNLQKVMDNSERLI